VLATGLSERWPDLCGAGIKPGQQRLLEKEFDMLVLTRKERERLRIGNDIVIVVLKLKSGGVRLGIEAPKDVPVLRDELKEKPQVAC